jgi:hypothetical protein
VFTDPLYFVWMYNRLSVEVLVTQFMPPKLYEMPILRPVESTPVEAVNSRAFFGNILWTPVCREFTAIRTSFIRALVVLFKFRLH